MHFFYPRTPSPALTQTHTAPQIPVFGKGWVGKRWKLRPPRQWSGKVRAGDFAATSPGAAWDAGAANRTRLPSPRSDLRRFQLCRWGVSRFSPGAPFLLPCLPPSGFFSSTFSPLGLTGFCPSSPPSTPLRGPEGTSDFAFTEWELSTSSISQRHIKKSRQVQVNHEMVTF